MKTDLEILKDLFERNNIEYQYDETFHKIKIEEGTKGVLGYTGFVTYFDFETVTNKLTGILLFEI